MHLVVLDNLEYLANLWVLINPAYLGSHLHSPAFPANLLGLVSLHSRLYQDNLDDLDGLAKNTCPQAAQSKDLNLVTLVGPLNLVSLDNLADPVHLQSTAVDLLHHLDVLDHHDQGNLVVDLDGLNMALPNRVVLEDQVLQNVMVELDPPASRDVDLNLDALVALVSLANLDTLEALANLDTLEVLANLGLLHNLDDQVHLHSQIVVAPSRNLDVLEYRLAQVNLAADLDSLDILLPNQASLEDQAL